MTQASKFVFIDRKKYDWDQPTITGAQLRTLAGVPEGADVFLKVPGQPDKPIGANEVIDLTAIPGETAHFSTQSRGSQAG